MKFPFELIYPWALAGLAGLPLVWWAARHTLALVTKRRRRLSWALRSIILVLVALALATTLHAAATKKVTTLHCTNDVS